MGSTGTGEVLQDIMSKETGMYKKYLESESLVKLRPVEIKLPEGDPEAKRNVNKLVLNKYQSTGAHSRATQTSEEQHASIPWNERYENALRSIESTSFAKSGKPTSEDRHRSGYHDENLSSKIGERFATLNLNLTKQIPEDFKIYVDCQQFKPNEIKVAVMDGCIVVHGKHEVKLDDHGFIEREFDRRWGIPKDVKREEFSCLLDNYGVLTIRAPRKPNTIVVPLQIEKRS